jgi:outer membrane protein assembly factor BamB
LNPHPLFRGCILSLILFGAPVAAIAGTPTAQGSAGADAWPEYRGPSANGHSSAIGLPTQWSETKNVRWKTPIHGKGWSSPVIWGRQVWMTTATPDGKALWVVCVDRETGKILHDRKLFDVGNPAVIHDVNSYASPSPVIEAGRVYVHFGTYGTAAIDTKSFETVWERRDLNCEHSVGPGSSPVLYGGLLILTYDGIDKQFAVALDKKTGKNIWKVDRATAWNDGGVGERRKAFDTPVIIKVGGKDQLVSLGAQAAFGYDPLTGAEIWRVRHIGYSNSSRALYGEGLLIFSTGFDKSELVAVRLEGDLAAKEDITTSNQAWRYTRNVPYKPCSLLIDGLVYLTNDSGMVTCLEAKTGSEVWKERVEGHFSASPVYAGGLVYCFTEEGKTLVFKPGRTWQVVAENTLDGGFMASPAIAGKALFLRTKTHLYRVEGG